MVVSFNDYEVTARYDGTSWTQARISESDAETGPWTVIDTINLPHEPDPANPSDKSFTTNNATLTSGWYLVEFLDAQSNILTTEPVYNAPGSSYEILATLDDVNANLDGHVVEADAENSKLIQVSVARVIKAYLSGAVPATTTVVWVSPETTPDIIRSIAGMLIAAQVYYNEISKASTNVETTSYAQVLYNRAIGLLDKIISGEIASLGGSEAPPPSIYTLTTDDFFPVDSTDRAFTLSMEL
jgi:hypothetical protein